MDSVRPSRPAAAPPRTAPVAAADARRLAGIGLWLVLLPLAGWAGLRLAGAEPKFRWSQAVSFTPYAAAASLVPLLAAVGLRRRATAVAAFAVTASLAAAVLPRALPDGNPPADGPSLRVLSANLYHGSVPAGALMDALRRHRPDVLVMVEFTPETAAALDRAGVARLLPYRVSAPEPDGQGSAVYSRLPLRADGPPLPGEGPRQIPALLTLPDGREVSVVAVHACAPSGGWRSGCWASSIRALPPAGGRLRVLAGDFNSTLDHAVLRELIATGYRDAADVTGKGLAMTWPYLDQPWFFPKVAIDHLLADSRIAIRSFATSALPGTDHRAVVTEITLPAAS
ncbi:endonuclease/exonuclease/phosphatase family protein [Microbispora sp. ATCC PTA-5024]|uniref:endonuclease/exonuclease/phosphatase family protein n=1 Tax=Microbispora sp. ATCC PTA-5024 TaxID=316330 RepID=UPI0003DD9E5B|nr:endonuclease/exonuclease/phosphatase family protein [Microbispora sp. ATCC PTA-5024]ETK34314.1 hypothetical protein MPTA5024_20040 [Microbispora sp. ATCC PTA-5024]